jgi:hypothetical protein
MAFRLIRLSLFAWFCASGVVVWAAPVTAQPVVTNKTRFRIPFRFDAAALERMNARELRLYVSSDAGTTWEMTQTIGVQSGKFEFQAPRDGEYRFAVKTLDAANQLHPPGDTYETGLVVIVDTKAPELALELRQGDPGKVELHWRATDSNLDTSTLRLDYTQPGVNDWQSVSVAPRGTGQTAWSVPQGGMVAVRGSIADLAGNQGRLEIQARVEPAAEGNTGPRKPDLRQPIAETPVIAPEQGPITDDFTATPPQLSPLAAQQMVDTKTPPPVVERQPVIISQPTQFVATDAGQRPEIAQNRWTEMANHAEPQPAAGARPTGRQRVVRTRTFQIGYQVEDVGPSGLGGVELFITQDQGRRWWKYGDDPDHQSPFDVEVPEDGVYGFAIRARSGVGLSNDPPVTGEAPAIVVAVDQTPPQLEMLPVRQGMGTQVNKLQLRWKITDDHPSDQPVAIFFAANPNGPWETISSWRADTGEYVWTVSPGMPSQVYFRVVARDAAGNTTQEQTDRPVIVDLSRPSARIVDVEARANDLHPQ